MTPGFPLAKLKNGYIMMLLRNLSHDCLCNGTCLIVRKICSSVLHCDEVFTGEKKGDAVNFRQIK